MLNAVMDPARGDQPWQPPPRAPPEQEPLLSCGRAASPTLPPSPAGSLLGRCSCEGRRCAAGSGRRCCLGRRRAAGGGGSGRAWVKGAAAAGSVVCCAHPAPTLAAQHMSSHTWAATPAQRWEGSTLASIMIKATGGKSGYLNFPSVPMRPHDFQVPGAFTSAAAGQQGGWVTRPCLLSRAADGGRLPSTGQAHATPLARAGSCMAAAAWAHPR